ncbi:Phosphoribosylformylglycinamidine synthase subunit PurQ [Azospirillaceae bacterium]
MKAAVIVFPGSNRERDIMLALESASGRPPLLVWHRDSDLPPVDLIVLPGGFSYGDYLRAGAMAARSPIMQAVIKRAQAGVRVLGVCNGFQMLTETRLLPGALMRNAGLKFICRRVGLRVERNDTFFTAGYRVGQEIDVPIAHADGNYFADAETLKRIEGDGQVAFRYVNNPNGSVNDIAGVYNETRTVLGMMPHPENVVDPTLGGVDGRCLFEGIARALAA